MHFFDRRTFLVRSLNAAAAGLALHASRARAAEPMLLDYPIGITVGKQGAVYITDQDAQTIFRVQGDKLAVVYKGSKRFRTPLYRAKALAQDSAGNLFVCDTGSTDVWRLAPDGDQVKLAPLTGEKLSKPGNGAPNDAFDPDAAYAGQLDKPLAIVIDADGNPVVADLGLHAIVRIPAAGGAPQTIASVPAPRGIAQDRAGAFAVVSHGKDQLVRVAPDGTVTPIVKGQLAPNNFPHNVVADGNGYVVSDGYARTLWRVTHDGKATPLAQGAPFKNPVGIALESDGNILVIDPHAKALFRVSPDGKVSTVLSNETLSKK